MLADAAAGLQVLRVVAFVLVASDLALRLVLFFHYININFMTAYCAYLKNKQKNTERVGHIKNVDEIISFFLFWLWKKRRKVSIIRCYEDNYCKKKTKNSREINKTLYAVLTEKRKRNKSGRKPNYYKFVASRILLDKKTSYQQKKALYPDYFFVLIEKNKFFFCYFGGREKLQENIKNITITYYYCYKKPNSSTLIILF